jgi:hypothetical protein
MSQQRAAAVSGGDDILIAGDAPAAGLRALTRPPRLVSRSTSQWVSRLKRLLAVSLSSSARQN